MLKLLVLRAAPLFLRPAAIFLEAVLVSGDYVLIFVLPVAMMALTLSSIPLHLDYYKSFQDPLGMAARSYISGLTWIVIFSTTSLVSITYLMFQDAPQGLFFAIAFTFLIEKLADEASRALEFQKQFFGWFLIQMSRSGWFFLPLLLMVLGFDYLLSFVVSAAFIVIIFATIFFSVLKIPLSMSASGLQLILKNIVYFFGSVLPASYMQIPRMLVVKYYPEVSHGYLIIGQLCQGFSLLFNVRFQIPYRKVIARRTKAFQRIMWPVMVKLIWIILSIALLYVFIIFYFLDFEFDLYLLSALLVPVMTADAILFSIMTAHLGYVSWFVSRRAALKTYLLCVFAGVGVATAVGAAGGLLVSPLILPVTTMFVGALWVMIIYILHFSFKGSK